MNTSNTYEQEIDLKDLMFAVLYKWRVIIGVAVLLAVLLGGYKAVTAYRSVMDPQKLADADKAYQKSLEDFAKNKETKERELNNLKQDLDEQQHYVDYSIRMHMSPYDIWEAKTALFVKTGYQILPEMSYQNINYTDTVLQSYNLALTGTEFMNTVAEAMGVERRYLNEVVTISVGNNMITLQVRYTDEENAKKVMDLLVAGVYKFQEQISNSIGKHEISEISSSIGSLVDLSLIDTQEDQQNRLRNLTDSYNAKQEEVNNLSEPSAPTTSLTSVYKDGAKYAVLGGVLGAFMVVFFVCVVFLMSDKLYSAKQLKSNCGMRVLGALPIPAKKKKFVLDRWFNRLEGRAVAGAEALEYSLISANILNYASEAKKLLIVGTAPKEAIAKVAGELGEALKGMEIVAEGNMLQDSELLRKLPECDGVVLVEQCGCSTYSGVKLEAEKIVDLQKKIVGCVVFE